MRTCEFRDYDATDTLLDGESIRVRAIHPVDREKLVKHFESLSPESVYFRFFGPKKTLSAQELAHFTEVDYRDHVALIATVNDRDGERIIGVGRYFVANGSEAEKRSAEVAFAVPDDYQGHGVATILLKRLCAIARAQGLSEFTANVLGGNRRMIEVLVSNGFSVRRKLNSGTIQLTLPI
jgi:RimJ/RimL family protein N-acetyltransferase